MRESMANFIHISRECECKLKPPLHHFLGKIIIYHKCILNSNNACFGIYLELKQGASKFEMGMYHHICFIFLFFYLNILSFHIATIKILDGE